MLTTVAIFSLDHGFRASSEYLSVEIPWPCKWPWLNCRSFSLIESVVDGGFDDDALLLLLPANGAMSFSRRSCLSLGAFVEMADAEVSLAEIKAVVEVAVDVVVGPLLLSCCRALMRSRNDTLRPPAALAARVVDLAEAEGAGGEAVVGVVSVTVMVVGWTGGVQVTWGDCTVIWKKIEELRICGRDRKCIILIACFML